MFPFRGPESEEENRTRFMPEGPFELSLTRYGPNRNRRGKSMTSRETKIRQAHTCETVECLA